jgi:hypothetical protein
MTVNELLAMKNPKFRDFLALKVGGKDEFSRLGYAALRSRMTEADIIKVEEALEVHADRAKVYRWILRGLPVDYAVRKVKTDLEVAANAKYARQERDFCEDDKNVDWTFDAMRDGEDLDEIIHPPERPKETTVGEFTLVRPHANKVVITKDGEILAEKEINNERHFASFLAKFRQDKAYRDSLTKGA